ncbi:MAG: helix-turn-helix transcriptional regulator [Gammaproteobacteria bacterium]|nr:helix-turn-helix transcriptional regulator [Gammaproteobacteria bacterium]
MSAVMTTDSPAVFMNVKQVASYLHLNEKKIYAMASEGRIPATKITGKWMFPRELIDRWMLDSAHGGLLVDRLAIAGSDDPLLYRVVTGFTRDLKAHAQISYTPTGTRLGLDLLQSQRIDVGGLHWGPGAESHTRHPALLRQYSQHRNWVLIRAFSREQGLMARPSVLRQTSDPTELAASRFRWVQRQSGSGAQRFLMEMYNQPGACPHGLNVTTTALSEREAATAIVMDQADIAPGSRAAANEAGLGFVSFGWESFDFALPRNIWFRRLFQELLSRLTSGEGRRLADSLGGYEMKDTGELVWAHE